MDYELQFSFLSLSHIDLTILFAFGWHFYLVLYILVGILSLMNMAVFSSYHRLMARPKKGSTIAKFKFFSYLSLTIPPALNGSGLALLPVFLANLWIAVCITGKLFKFEFHLFECDAPEGPSGCALTFLDVIPDDPATVSIDYQMLRNGRCGLSFIVLGVYLMRESMIILIPDKTDKSKVNDAFDGNAWEYFTWKRTNMIYVSTFIIFIMLATIQFSFSDLFGVQIWFSIGCLKVMGIMIDYSLDAAMDEAFLASPISMNVIVILGLVTFGADDFLDFLSAFFIELGIMMFERTYLSGIIGFLEDNVMEAAPRIFEILKNPFGGDDDLLDDEEIALLIKQGKDVEEEMMKMEEEKNKNETESSESEVYFSEEESLD